MSHDDIDFDIQESGCCQVFKFQYGNNFTDTVTVTDIVIGIALTVGP